MMLPPLSLLLVFSGVAAPPTAAPAQPAPSQPANSWRGYPVQPPPAPVVETVAPRPGFVWVPGHHAWRQRRYAWTPGFWVRERPGHRFHPGRWEWEGDRYAWIDGEWLAGPSVSAGI